MRKRQIYIDKYGPEIGPKLYHLLQSQAAHAGVSARLRRKIEALSKRPEPPLPLFREPEADPRDGAEARDEAAVMATAS